MILLPGLLLLLWGEPGRCRGGADGDFTFDGDIRHIAVANGPLYIATEEKLYQLSHDLNLVQSVNLRGVLKSGDEVQFYRVSEPERWNSTFRVNVLLPFVSNGTLISCGMIDHGCGYCEALDLRNISKVVHREDIQVGPQGRNSSGSVSFLVTVDKGSSRQVYIQTAIQQPEKKEQPGEKSDDLKDLCRSDMKIVNLQNTDEKQEGGIFSYNEIGSTPEFSTKEVLEFVDGFQISSVIYLLSNVPTRNRVRLFWFEGKTSKIQTLQSLRGAVLSVSEDGGGHNRLVASSVIPSGPGSPVLWSGVFSMVSGQTDTELVLFELSPDLSGLTNADPDLYINRAGTELKILKPRAVLFRKNHMTSVLAVRKKTWMVFLIGTRDGQLIKLAVDKDYRTTCPTVLYRANDDRPLFPKILLDQIDHKHVYVPFQKQIVRVPVAKCNTHTNLQDCWSAQDPDCVWCNGSSCTFEDNCGGSDWLSIPGDHQQKMISHSISKAPTGQLTLNVQAHLTAGNEVLSQFVCQFPESGCTLTGRPPAFPKCTCILSDSILPTEGLEVPVRIRLGSVKLLERLTLTNCSDIMGAPTAVLCQQCISAGCGWSINRCTWANQGERNVSVCQLGMLGTNISKPEIFSITPSVVSFHGKNHAVLTGRNLSHVTRVRILTESCSPRESPVWNNTGMSLTFHILSADSKGSAEVCALLPDGSCHGNENITYQSAPLCTSSTPTSTWVSGKRRITLTGSHLDFVEGVTHSHAPQEIKLPGNSSYETLTYDSPAARHTQETLNSTVSLKVANQTVSCSTSIAYYPDPEFTSFTSTRRGDDVRIIIEKKADRLEMTTAELTAYGIHGGKPHRCIMVVKETKNLSDFFTCDIKSTPVTKFQELEIKYGDRTVRLNLKSPPMNLLMLLVLLLIPIIIIMLVIVYRRKQQKFTAEMNRMMEDLEMDIRNDIRQGFVDLQTEKAELMENVGAIPFLDYKHFASRIFFPESDSLMTSCIRDIGQDAVKVQLDECCQGLSRLIQNQLFLTTMVHALEEQKSFTIKDKCLLASLLTVALHGNLSYLTEVMETLLKALMQQNSNTQPKLLLRRTESTVEKLLTNWMSICLYGYLRESVGQHLFLMVSTLSQQITKGPVDCVTEKALYTLSEDWLLWQAPHFNSLKLKVLFAVGSDGEVSEPLEVNALSCDSVEQVKEKILSTFKAKFGFPYNFPLRDICIEIEKNSSFVLLEEVDRSSEVVGEVTMLNTLRHYKVPDGATIKVLSKTARPPLSPQGSLKDDENFSGKYFHLIDPDVVEDQRKNPERKKLKLKEVHLTKLLSTKVAVHSSVENLFRSIWGTPHSRALHAVKYFFDFLDAQADNMKITDPDVLHIWKTNSLPLRFWVNILKNPQFVFDMEKSPHLDGCLSVIAQAFMDSFSLSDTQLGKHAPTNKLLYAKDIPTFKQEVKAYYKQIRERPPITESEFNNFLQEESKKHENKFNEALALRELYRFIQRYFTEIKEKLDQNGVPTELTEQLHHVKGLFDQLKSCSWD